MSESGFRSTLMSNLKAAFGIRCYPVESHSTCPGIPDVHFLCPQPLVTGWLELKVTDALFPTSIQYRPGQAAWLEDYARHGGVCWTIVKSQYSLRLIHGANSGRAETNLRNTPHITLCPEGGKVWTELARILVQPYKPVG